MSRDAGGSAPLGGALPLLVGERLDHLFGDIDLLAREHHGILQDQVEFLRLGDLLAAARIEDPAARARMAAHLAAL